MIMAPDFFHNLLLTLFFWWGVMSQIRSTCTWKTVMESHHLGLEGGSQTSSPIPFLRILRPRDGKTLAQGATLTWSQTWVEIHVT